MAKLPTFPAIDLSSLPKIDLPKVDLPSIDTDRLTDLVRDAAYVVVGFGVLGFQQLQVRRRELAASMSSSPVAKQVGLGKAQVEELVGSLESRLSALDARFDAAEAKIDGVVETIEARLPAQAGAVLGQAHELAKTARKQVRSLVRVA